MALTYSNSKDLTLELVFIGLSTSEIQESVERETRLRLTDAQFWRQDLRNWMNILRNDRTLICPEIVRKTSAFSLGLQLTDDSTITKLNSIWLNKEESTDVLSFPVLDDGFVVPEEEFVELGDIVVSVPMAERQAKAMNHALVAELRWLVSHGLLHLLGWEHPDSTSLNEMLSCQQQLLAINGNLQHRGDAKEEITDAS